MKKISGKKYTAKEPAGQFRCDVRTIGKQAVTSTTVAQTERIQERKGA
jgi:hypothetical protein